MKVAILEDSAPFQILIEHYVLQAHPAAQIEFFDKGDALLKRIGNQSFDLVVADLDLWYCESAITISALEALMESDPTELVVFSVGNTVAEPLLNKWEGWVRQICGFSGDQTLLRVLNELAL